MRGVLTQIHRLWLISVEILISNWFSILSLLDGLNVSSGAFSEWKLLFGDFK